MSTRRSSPFLYRLFFLAAAAIVPLLVLRGWQIAAEHAQAERDALDAVRGHAATMSHEMTATLARAQQLMLFLAQRPEIRAIDRPRCTALLQDLVQLDAVYAEVSLFDAGGTPVCIESRAERPLGNALQQDWFKQVRDGAEFGYGSAVPGSITQRAVLSLSHGMRDEKGHLLGVLRVSLDLIRWADGWGHLTLPPDSVISLEDANARIISRYPDPQRWVGHDVRAISEAFHRRNPDGAGRSEGLLGVTRYFAVQPMQPQGWSVIVGMPAEPLEAQARERLLTGALAALLISVVTLAMAWLMAQRLAAPLARLAHTARRVAAGRLDARASVDAHDDFRDVALEFNRMLDARALAELRADRVARFYAALSQTNQAILRSGDSAALLHEICEICVAAGHARLAVIGVLEEDGGILRQAASSSPEIGPHFAGMDRPFDLRRPEDAQTRIGRTLIEGEHQIANDFLKQAATPEWREIAREEGIGAMACFPIRRGGRVSGVLTLYVAEADFFDRALIELLDEMAKDLSYALDSREAAAAQASAEAASRAKTEFLSRIGHELRTPLNAVLGFAQMLGEPASGAALSAEQAAQVEHIRAAGWHLLALIDDILDVAAVESGRLRVEFAAVDVAAEIDAALALCKLPAEQAGVALRAQLPAGRSLRARCDAVRLRQVLINLLTNAIKYNRPGGSASVSLRATAAEPRRVLVEIRDDGAGMSAEQLQQLFEPFNRLGRESGPVKGLGIGLALTRQLVELMGGSIEVSSDVDAGTRVLLSLPLAEDRAPPAPPLLAAPAAPAASMAPLRGKLLYVEDNEINVLVLSQFLARWPELQLEIATDGQQGLARAAAMQPDLLLLDMHLPDMDGYELLHELRQRPDTAALRVVVLSASAMPEEVARARAAGALDYWTKPLDFKRLERELRELLPAAPE